MNRNHMQEIIDRQDKAMSEIRDRRDMIGTRFVASLLVHVGFGITLSTGTLAPFLHLLQQGLFLFGRFGEQASGRVQGVCCGFVILRVVAVLFLHPSEFTPENTEGRLVARFLSP